MSDLNNMTYEERLCAAVRCLDKKAQMDQLRVIIRAEKEQKRREIDARKAERAAKKALKDAEIAAKKEAKAAKKKAKHTPLIVEDLDHEDNGFDGFDPEDLV